jgi:hypothetical protein
MAVALAKILFQQMLLRNSRTVLIINHSGANAGAIFV